MRHLMTFDKKDYQHHHPTIKREAVRAIIFKDQKLCLIQSQAYQELKFPGGGIHKDEDYIDALAREVLEETGLTLKRKSIKAYGYVKEIRKSTVLENEIFDMTSYYYIASCEDEIKPTNLDDYEKNLGYHLVYMTLEDAIQRNEIAYHKFPEVSWIKRELSVLNMLLEEQIDDTI